jgi:polysaccharide export outer membrane protein
MKKFINCCFVFYFILFAYSCVPLRSSIYLQGDIAKKLSEIDIQSKPEKSDYLVRPSDVLYITVASLDERTSAFFNSNASFTQLPESPMAISLMGYRVNLDGSIEFPFIGKIFVSGLTLEQIRDKIHLAVGKYIDQSSVTVKLLNDNITVVGEVRNPGRFLMASEEINIIEALSLAGDVTEYGNRRKVRLIRKEGNVFEMVEVNLLDEKVMLSPYFYLKPGDILYVEPRRLQSWSLTSIPLGMTITLLNTAVLLMTYIQVANQNQN